MILAHRAVRSLRRARFRPILDRLEGRALMAYAGGLDPTFGAGTGTMLVPVKSGAGTGLYALSLVQVESDGSIVAAGPVGYQNRPSIGVVHLRADGTPDTSFGVSGEADVVLPSGITPYNPTALMVQPDGTITVVTAGQTAGSTSQVVSIVARFDANGSPDSSFGTEGVVVLDPSQLGLTSSYFSHGAIQADGQVILAGSSEAPTTFPLLANQQVSVVRLDANGSLDPTFGTGGLANFEIPSQGSSRFDDDVLGLAIQPDGRAVVLAEDIDGTAHGTIQEGLIRLNLDGSRDGSLGQMGLIAAGVYQSEDDSLIVQPDGKFLISNTQGTGNEPTLARLNADGTLDKTLTVDDPADDYVTGFALQPDGKIDLYTGGAVIRVDANLTVDATFGLGGASRPAVPALGGTNGGNDNPLVYNAFAVGPDNRIILAGSNYQFPGLRELPPIPASELGFARLTSTGTSAHPGDFDGDGIADPAIYLTNFGAFALAYSSGTPSQLIQFGGPGLGTTIPAAGNYNATGKQEIGAYLPGLGVYAYRPPTGPDVYVKLGTSGPGLTIPAPGDYFGTGRDDVAVYLADLGAFAVVDPTGQTPGEVVSFGMTGVGNAIPVPGDYFGTGKTDFAVYLPTLGEFEIQQPDGADRFIPFGGPGLGTALPMPGDYDGSGRTELAVYLPAYGLLAYRPANGGSDVYIPFGGPGIGTVLPMAGDYTGSGRTEPGVYIPALGELAYRPFTGPDVYFPFGSPAAGQTIPVTSVSLFESELVPGSNSGGTVYALSVPNVVGGLETPGSKRAKLGDVRPWEPPALV